MHVSSLIVPDSPYVPISNLSIYPKLSFFTLCFKTYIDTQRKQSQEIKTTKNKIKTNKQKTNKTKTVQKSKMK